MLSRTMEWQQMAEDGGTACQWKCPSQVFGLTPRCVGSSQNEHAWSHGGPIGEATCESPIAKAILGE